jgi:hypothetical protein
MSLCVEKYELIYSNYKWRLNGIPFTGIATYTLLTNEPVYTHYKDGRYHREDGPAIYTPSFSYKMWYIGNSAIRTWKQYHEQSTLSPQEQMIVKLKYGEQLRGT